MMTDPTGLEGKRILILEDDFYLATDEAAALGGAGADVIGCTASAEEARGLIEKERIDFALVDINLGQGPTFEIARALRARKIPFVFTTGYDASAIPEEFGDIHRLEKPFEHQKLLTTVKRLV